MWWYIFIILDLEKYLLSKDRNMLWETEDDLVFKNLRSVKDLNYRLLLRYKGKKNIQDRIQFKNIKLNFDIWILIINN